MDDLLRCLWQSGARGMEVPTAEVDRGGYDLVLEANGIPLLQLQASHATAQAREVNNINLAPFLDAATGAEWIP